ncbi:CRE-MMAA-1 protein [Cladochytrium replicatum]|nr:CRE-MMAA-1 protein [Cladochytrium replicatum]
MFRVLAAPYSKTAACVAAAGRVLQRSALASLAGATTGNEVDARDLYRRLVNNDRAALSRAITLVESLRNDHKELAGKLLLLILDESRRRANKMHASITQSKLLPTTFRIGLSGSPGVGKSSFIETFGMFLLDQGHRVAVLAVDPSSTRTGGSILGDKTRMYELSRSFDAYIRPSPSSGTLGGVARNTNDAILICEAAGYDIVLVETVGVGQSETMVADMVDMFVLLVAPAGGDELQGMKKGIVEMTDLVLVNKSDGDLQNAARMAQMEYISALKFVQPIAESWRPQVLRVSSAKKTGIDDAWKVMADYYNLVQQNGLLESRRANQRKVWMWRQIKEEMLLRLKNDTSLQNLILELETAVFDGKMTSGQAAEIIISDFFDGSLKN